MASPTRLLVLRGCCLGLMSVALGAACGDAVDAGGATDAGPEQADVGPDTTADVVAPDASSPDAMLPDAAVDGAADAHDAGPSVMLMVGASINAALPPYASSYAAGAWAAISTLTGTDCFPPGGGGVAVLPDGRGVAVVRGNASSLPASATWTAGVWSGATATGATSTSYVSGPLATSTGAVYARLPGGPPPGLVVDTFATATSAWTTGTSLALSGDNSTLPALARRGAGDLLLIDKESTGNYRWMPRTGATWGTPATVAGITAPGFGNAASAVTAAARTGVDEVVAVFVAAGATSSDARLVSSSFVAGAWSAPAIVATNVFAGSQLGAPAQLAALPGGRMALAYLTTTNAVSVGFYDGVSWGTFKAVPGGVSSVAQASPFSLARGADTSTVLELVYVDGQRRVRHTRLTDEATWTWSAPASIDTTARQWESVWIAVGP